MTSAEPDFAAVHRDLARLPVGPQRASLEQRLKAAETRYLLATQAASRRPTVTTKPKPQMTESQVAAALAAMTQEERAGYLLAATYRVGIRPAVPR
jgi:hypothetical protein